jgi:hypothetical protein
VVITGEIGLQKLDPKPAKSRQRSSAKSFCPRDDSVRLTIIMLRIIARIFLVVFGLFFAIGALNIAAAIRASHASAGYFMGTLFGHALFLVFAVLCFRKFRQMGEKQKL